MGGAGVYVGWPGASVAVGAEEPDGVALAAGLVEPPVEAPVAPLEIEPVLARACATPPDDPSTWTAPSATADPRPLLMPSLPLGSITLEPLEEPVPLVPVFDGRDSLSSDALCAAAASERKGLFFATLLPPPEKARK